MRPLRSNETLLETALGAAPTALVELPRMDIRVAHWSVPFLERYEIPSLDDPLLSVHLGGTPRIRLGDGARWSRRGSVPGTVNFLPDRGSRTSWLANGAVVAVTMSVGSRSPMREAISAVRRELEVGVPDALTVALMQSMTAALATGGDADLEGRRYLDSLSETLLLHLARAGGRPRLPGPPASPVLRIADYIERHCTEDLRVEMLAAEAGLSPAYFSELFRKTVGMPPHRYLLQARIERAREALSLTSLDLASIALELGFSSQSHLTAVFRKIVGMTPAEYRRATAGDS